jgi:hypothetical protein
MAVRLHQHPYQTVKIPFHCSLAADFAFTTAFPGYAPMMAEAVPAAIVDLTAMVVEEGVDSDAISWEGYAGDRPAVEVLTVEVELTAGAPDLEEEDLPEPQWRGQRPSPLVLKPGHRALQEALSNARKFGYGYSRIDRRHIIALLSMRSPRYHHCPSCI